MFKLQLMTAYGGITLSLTSKTSNENAPIEYAVVANPAAVGVYGTEGQLRSAAVKEVEKRLLVAYNPFGHILLDQGSVTNPIDLHYAVSTYLSDLKPDVIEGAELIAKYDPGIPAGEVT